MIYLDTSVALAHLLAEDARPPAALWREILVSSRLLEYEVMVRLHARRLEATHGEEARLLLARVAFLELGSAVLERALAPFPTAVRTLDALHLSSLLFLVERRQEVSLASYDRRMVEGARALSIPIWSPA